MTVPHEGEVYRGDCNDLVAEIVRADARYDHIITSPPYPQGKKAEDQGRYRRKGTAAEQREEIHHFKHGEPTRKGEIGLEIRIAAPDWLDWFVGVADVLKVGLRKNGNLIVNVDSCCYPVRHRHWGVFSLPERMEARGWCFVDALLWLKTNGPPVSAPGRFHHSWEFIYWFAKGDRWSADLDALRTLHSPATLARFARGVAPPRGQWNQRGGGYEPTAPHPDGARPKDLFVWPVGQTPWDAVGERHNAVMPLGLAEELVQAFSKPGEVVFDPFGGAGTTAAACIRQERRFVLSEITERAAVIAERRIQLATQGYLDEELAAEMEQRVLGF